MFEWYNDIWNYFQPSNLSKPSRPFDVLFFALFTNCMISYSVTGSIYKESILLIFDRYCVKSLSLLLLGMSLASAGPMFTKNWLKPFATFLSPINVCPLLLNSVQHIYFLLCLLMRIFIIFHVSFMFPLFASKMSV